MTRTHACMTFLAACHLALVVCGSIQQRIVDELHPASTALRCYGAMSGSDNGYGFFAPSVAGERQLTYTLTDAKGKSWTETMDMRAHGKEVNLRVLPLLLMFSEPRLGNPMAASIAAKLFGRYPDAVQAMVQIEVSVCPSMKEYREGARPQWVVGYEATFIREDQESPPSKGKEP